MLAQSDARQTIDDSHAGLDTQPKGLWEDSIIDPDADSTPEAQPFFVHKHPAEGQLSLRISPGGIRFECQWPFDLSTNEWISIDNEFDHDAYVAAISRLAHNRVARIKAKKAGYIQFTLTSEAKIRLEVTSDSPQSPVHLNAMLDLSPSCLLPNWQ